MNTQNNQLFDILIHEQMGSGLHADSHTAEVIMKPLISPPVAYEYECSLSTIEKAVQPEMLHESMQELSS